MLDYVSDVPLKPTKKTFFDPPEQIDDVNLEELVFDFRLESRESGSIQLLEAIKILGQMLQDIIQLQQYPDLFHDFRVQIFKELKLSPNTTSLTQNDDESDSIRIEVSSQINDEPTPNSVNHIPIGDLIARTNLSHEAKVLHPITEPNPSRLQQDYENNHTQSPQLLKIFNLVSRPSITIEEFLLRIMTYSPSVSASSYLHSAYMLFNLSVLFDVVPLNYYNVYRLILGSIRCSTKCLEDIFQRQKSFATVGGVSLKDLLKIEVGFLYLVKFRLVIGSGILDQFLQKQWLRLRTFCQEKIPNVDISKSN
ncbi:hypothetical protein DIURU_002140 [Diutina rugosa]|uniref:Uncharacterized protein n=1 Tax=Diutina rugosa TaxID=5481 RepID=A0A642UR87_DIURU|nr:uncharacterized protein DIURU_002140 [Diutina rugosa]KAA8903918.1 hypothetical protein DIURU_002140 [Diutina rugosa]